MTPQDPVLATYIDAVLDHVCALGCFRCVKRQRFLLSVGITPRFTWVASLSAGSGAGIGRPGRLCFVSGLRKAMLPQGPRGGGGGGGAIIGSSQHHQVMATYFVLFQMAPVVIWLRRFQAGFWT